jgi:hypothetical protein
VRRCRVAATQVDVRHGDVEHNLETHVRLIAEAATAGCELVVFPELSVTGHNGSPEVTRGAERADGRIAQVIEEAARASGIVASYGFCELHRGTHLPHANRTLEAPDGSHAFDGREREAGTDELLRAQETLLADSPVPPRLPTSWRVTTACSRSSPTRSASTGTARTSGAHTCSRPTVR